MYLGVFDIGGTSIKYGIVNLEGKLLFHDSLPTEAHMGGEAVIQKVINISKELIDRWKISGISISSAGQVNSETGMVVYATDNIPRYTGLNITELIQKETHLPVMVENDVNCTALGEYWLGAAKDVDDFICVTIGTGIGGALFLDGKLYTGKGYCAGEIGHITLYPDGRECTCGKNGCFESYASSKALTDLITKAAGNTVPLIQFFKAVKAGDPESLALFELWLNDLTTGLKSIVHLLNPELIVLGGGISAQGDFLLEAIKDSLFPKLMPNHAATLEIMLAKNGNDANLLGAAQNFYMHSTHGGDC
ncbi:ROK family protein [Bacillus haikouensis]|uniref:ROK family protein n=1 Tax=Bacillus haikouensis TaxID=1510468 RepID=UPI001552226E|nr:ROK family protein [Bacillus haikouensis]NQD67876.1 ROK family protein [Bacillus haikouensis]